MIIALLLIAAFAAGFMLRKPRHTAQPVQEAEHTHENNVDFWTCSMHPQIQQPEPGFCPICAMDLIPVSGSIEEDEDHRSLVKLTPYAQKLAELETAPVRRDFAKVRIRMPAKLAWDETRVSRIAARVPGRLEHLYADYTGIPVQKGDALFSVYSPELLTAQQELLQSIQLTGRVDPSNTLMQQRAQSTILASRDKLRLWGLSEDQVEAIVSRGKVAEELTVYAPTTGIVLEKHAHEGDYVKTGSPVYTIVDMRRLWLELDAYERDLPHLKYGQQVTFTVSAVPGITFTGQVSFIQPLLDEQTRTAKVRVNVENEDGQLKPGLLAQAVAESLIDPELTEAEAPLLVPAEAVLLTGKRAVVYVAGEEPGTYEGRLIALGPRAGDSYIVREGLKEGELVVTRGAFKLDSEVQIKAGPSMMNPSQSEGVGLSETITRITATPDFEKQLNQVLDAYYNLSGALSSDDAAKAQHKAATILHDLEQINAPSEEEALSAWKPMYDELMQQARSLAQQSDIQRQREIFKPLSDVLTQAVAQFGNRNQPVYQSLCPMAFNNSGAHWLQPQDEQINNPYFGSAMLRCGTIKQNIMQDHHE